MMCTALGFYVCVWFGIMGLWGMLQALRPVTDESLACSLPLSGWLSKAGGCEECEEAHSRAY